MASMSSSAHISSNVTGVSQPTASGNPPRISLLICGGLTGAALAVAGNYLELYSAFLAATAPEPYTLTAYDVVKEQVYPDFSDVDALVITGSASSAYDNTPWITGLTTYLARVVKEAPAVRIVGICFGHQVLARALGGECVPNSRWEVGPVKVRLTDAGRELFFGDVVSEVEEEFVTIQQMHRDHVPALPPSCVLLGASSIAPVQGYALFYGDEASSSPIAPTSNNAESRKDVASAVAAAHAPGPADDQAHPANEASNSTVLPSPIVGDGGDTLRETGKTPRRIHVLALQGHPEFPPGVVRELVAARTASGAIPDEIGIEYLERVKEIAGTRSSGDLGEAVEDDGRGCVARAVWGVILGRAWVRA